MNEKLDRHRLLFSIALTLAGALSTGRTLLARTWVPVGPPGNPAVTAMAIARPNYVVCSPTAHSILFAGTSGSVFRSDDGGATWSATGPITTGPGIGAAPRALAVRQVFHLGVDSGSYDSTVFAATGGGVLRLAPGASGWLPAN